MYLKELIQERIWTLWIVLLICSVLTLSHFYFISSIAQNIYYGTYIVLSIITFIITRKYYSLRIHHGVFIIFNLSLIFIASLNHVIAVPLLLLFPLFCSEKSHWVFKIFSSISYILLLVIMSFILFVRLIFSSTTLVKSVVSPNNKQIVEVYSVDEGALGGSTYVHSAKKYFYIFKKNHLIYSGHYGEGNNVKWIDNTHVKIDGKIIDIAAVK